MHLYGLCLFIVALFLAHCAEQSVFERSEKSSLQFPFLLQEDWGCELDLLLKLLCLGRTERLPGGFHEATGSARRKDAQVYRISTLGVYTHVKHIHLKVTKCTQTFVCFMCYARSVCQLTFLIIVQFSLPFLPQLSKFLSVYYKQNYPGELAKCRE